MKKQLTSLFMLVFVIGYFASAQQNNAIQKQKFHWGKDQDSATGYTQAVKVDNVIYISGTVSRDLSEQGVTNVYQRLEKTLQYFGASFQNVVKENLYTTDIEAMKAANAARKVFYKNDYPAATWVQISRLFVAEAKLEIELVAYLPR